MKLNVFTWMLFRTMNGLRLAAVLGFLAVCSSLHAYTINWSGVAFKTNVTSNGTAFDETMNFALGTFANDFTPTSSNLELWGENFKVFDVASYNPEAGFFASDANVDASGHSTSESALVDPGYVFASGDKAYLWVYNTETFGTGAEWALVTADNWVFAEFSGGCCGDLPLYWSVADIDEVSPTEGPIFGGVNDERGPGEYSFDPPEGYQLQTGIIPEPGAGLLFATAAGLLLRRRRKR